MPKIGTIAIGVARVVVLSWLLKIGKSGVWTLVYVFVCILIGRVNLVDIQQALNVDYSLIEAKVNDLVKSDRGLTLVLGQLIDRFVLT